MNVSQPAGDPRQPIQAQPAWFEAPPAGRQSHDIAQVVLSEERILSRARELGQAITRDYAPVLGGNPLLAIVTLRGAVTFAADLIKTIDLPVEMDFIEASSYGDSVTSSGVVQVTKDLQTSLAGRHALIIEDIVDSGLTLSSLLTVLDARRPASLRVCALLDKGKPGRVREDPNRLAYTGFLIPDAFVVGYGLDYAQRYRNLPYIGILKPEVYTRS